jgi:serine/threonine-protein kinase
MRALSRDRRDRFSSMSDLLAALEPQQGQGVFAVSAARNEAAPSRVGERADTTTENSTRQRPMRLDTALPAARKAPADLPERIGGKYLPIRLLATGDTSAVYEVEHLHTGEHLALKLMNPRAWSDPMSLARFKREARVSAQVKSDHVVRVIDADVAAELADSPFLVMELLQGQTLEELTAGYRQSSALVLNWMRQVTRGVERLHALGIVHRDLRPANLFRLHGADETVASQILDVGASKTLGAIDDQNTTTEGTIVGSPPYLSPEQASGDSAGVGPEADIWALGMTTYRLLAGREYWPGSDVATLLSLVLFSAIEPPSARGLALGKPFDQWFLRSCAREPDRRFACVDDQMRALESALGATRASAGEPDETNDSLASLALGPSRIPPRPEVSLRSTRRRESPWRARVAIAVVLLVAGAFLGHSASPGEATRVVPGQAIPPVAPPKAAALPPTTSGAAPPAPSIDSAPSSVPQARAAGTSLSGVQEAHRRRSSPPVHVAPQDPYAGPD